jgi:hypothetical protein
VVWWIGLFSVVYGLITLLPLIRQDSPYYAPLSIPAWFLYAGIRYVTFKVLVSSTSRYDSYETWRRCCDLRDRYRCWMLGGVEKKAGKWRRNGHRRLTLTSWAGQSVLWATMTRWKSSLRPSLASSTQRWSMISEDISPMTFREGSRMHWMDSWTVRWHPIRSLTRSNFVGLTSQWSAMDLIHDSNVSSILEGILFEHWDQVPKPLRWGTLWHVGVLAVINLLLICARHSCQGPCDCAGTR